MEKSKLLRFKKYYDKEHGIQEAMIKNFTVGH